MDHQQKAAIAAVERTMEASEALRANLRSSEAIGRKVIKKIESGVPFSAAVEAAGADASELRQNTHDLLAATSTAVMKCAWRSSGPRSTRD